MLYIYKYFRLCYLHFDGDENAFFKAIGFTNMALFIFTGIILFLYSLVSGNIIELPDLSKHKLWVYSLLHITIYYYTFKALLIKIMEVDPKNGISFLYDYNPSQKAVKINLIVHIMLLMVFVLLGFLRKAIIGK